MKRYNISVATNYEKDGVKKTVWNNVGKIVVFPPKDDKKEGGYMELFMFPGVKYNVFVQEDKPKQENTLGNQPATGEDITPSDIPF